MPAKKSRSDRYGESTDLPQTLQEAITYFADKQEAFAFAVCLRWPEGVISCPFCSSGEYSFITTRQLWKCKACRKQYSVRVGTIFEDSRISLSKWFLAIWMVANCKNGVSSYELHRAIEVTQKTAWFMLHRIRAAIKAKSFDRKLSGVVEADESYIGGLMKNLHKSKRRRLEGEAKGERETRAAEHRQLGKRVPVRTGAGPAMGKAIVQAVVERDGEVRAQILQTLGTLERAEFILENVEDGGKLMTDTGNACMGSRFVHEFINHQEEYVRGNVQTNSVENFWSLLQRTLHGTYVSVEPYHLSAYVDEQCFRFNQRKTNDGQRFVRPRPLTMTNGTRLTHKDLTRNEAN